MRHPPKRGKDTRTFFRTFFFTGNKRLFSNPRVGISYVGKKSVHILIAALTIVSTPFYVMPGRWATFSPELSTLTLPTIPLFKLLSMVNGVLSHRSLGSYFAFFPSHFHCERPLKWPCMNPPILGKPAAESSKQFQSENHREILFWWLGHSECNMPPQSMRKIILSVGFITGCMASD